MLSRPCSRQSWPLRLVGPADEHCLFCGVEGREGLRSWLVGGREAAVQAYTRLQDRDGGAKWPRSYGG